MNKPVVFAGTFDPVTNGHKDLILRARDIFGAVIVLLIPNAQKKTLFSVQERVELLSQLFEKEQGVRIDCAEGLLADYLKKNGLTVLVRGIRNADDFSYEMGLQEYNKLFYPQAQTVFLPARKADLYISSSAVKEAFFYGGDVSSLVPPCVLKALSLKK